MFKIVDECVGCPTHMGCLGSACPNRNIPILLCDECMGDCEEIFDVDGKHYCLDCLVEAVKDDAEAMGFDKMTVEDFEE